MPKSNEVTVNVGSVLRAALEVTSSERVMASLTRVMRQEMSSAVKRFQIVRTYPSVLSLSI